MTESVRQLSKNLKALETAIKPTQINDTIIEFSKQLAPTLKALETVKPLQVSGAIENIAKQLSSVSKAIDLSNQTNKINRQNIVFLSVDFSVFSNSCTSTLLMQYRYLSPVVTCPSKTISRSISGDFL